MKILSARGILHRNIILSGIAIGFCIACNDNPEKAGAGEPLTADSATTQGVPAASENPECYVNTGSKDSIVLHLTFTGNAVSGSMDYHIAEKDSNKGTLQGAMKEDTLFAAYTFQSEGKQSVRQVAFLKKAGSLLEGYGAVEEKGDSMVFTNTGALQFGQGVVLQRTACK